MKEVLLVKMEGLISPNENRIDPVLESELIHAIEEMNDVYLGDLVDTSYGDAVTGFKYDPEFIKKGENKQVETKTEPIHDMAIEKMSAATFSKVIGRSIKTLQRWDAGGILKPHRTSTGRLYYLRDDLLKVKELEADGTIERSRRVIAMDQENDPRERVAIFVRAEPTFYRKDTNVVSEQKNICLRYAEEMNWNVVAIEADVWSYTESLNKSSRFSSFCKKAANNGARKILVANPWVIPHYEEWAVDLFGYLTGITVEYVMYSTKNCPGLTYTTAQMLKLNPESPYTGYFEKTESDEQLINQIIKDSTYDKSVLPPRCIPTYHQYI